MADSPERHQLVHPKLSAVGCVAYDVSRCIACDVCKCAACDASGYIASDASGCIPDDRTGGRSHMLFDTRSHHQQISSGAPDGAHRDHLHFGKIERVLLSLPCQFWCALRLSTMYGMPTVVGLIYGPVCLPPCLTCGTSLMCSRFSTCLDSSSQSVPFLVPSLQESLPSFCI